MEKRIFIVGDDGINSLGVLRSLGEEKIFPYVIITEDKNRKPIIFKSRYIKNEKCVVIKKDSKALLNVLKQFYSNVEKGLIIPTSDFVLKFLSDYSDEISQYYIFPTVSADIGTLYDIMSKETMAIYAEKAGFAIPDMVKCNVNEEAVDNIDLYLRFKNKYPLILKSENMFIPGCDFIIVKNETELKDAIGKLTGNTIIIQQFIENAEEIAIQGVAFENNFKPKVFGVVHKIRTSLFALGTTTYAELRPLEDEKLRTISEKFAEIIGFNGIYDLDILIKDNNYYFIECNFRNGSNGYAYKKSGANLPFIWINGIYDNLNFDFNDKIRSIYFVNDIGDFAHLLHHNVKFFNWIWQYVTADAHLTFNFKDQGPFWAEFDFSRLIKSLKKR